MPVARTAQGLARQQSQKDVLATNKNKKRLEDEDDEEEEYDGDDAPETEPDADDDEEEYDDEEFADEEEEEDDEEESDDDSDDDDEEEEDDEELGPDPIHVTVQIQDSNDAGKIRHFRNDVTFSDFKEDVAKCLGLDPKSKFIISRKRKTKPPQQIMTKKHFDYMIDSYFEHADHFLRIIVTPNGGGGASAAPSAMTTLNNNNNLSLKTAAAMGATSNNMGGTLINATLGGTVNNNNNNNNMSPSGSNSNYPAENDKPLQNFQRPQSSMSMSQSNRPVSAFGMTQSRFGGTSSSDEFDIIRNTLDECAANNVEVTWHELRSFGAGAYGKVVEGNTEPGGHIVAIKHMNYPAGQGDAKKNASEAATMVEEIRLMKNLRHRHIVSYYGSQAKLLDDGSRTVDVFMEACHGGSLTTMRKRYGGRFKVGRVRDYMRQVIEGLAYLHLKQVVHRDIKADNVLISSQGVCKLADFGCSKKLGNASFESTMMLEMRDDGTVQNASSSNNSPQTMAAKNDGNMAKTLVGTPLFIAPEVLTESAEGYLQSADIWSIGCLVIELFGKKPWKLQNASVFSVMFAIAQAKTLPTGMPDIKCDPKLLDFLSKCFERDPAARPSARQLLDHPWMTCPDAELEEPVWSEDQQQQQQGEQQQQQA